MNRLECDRKPWPRISVQQAFAEWTKGLGGRDAPVSASSTIYVTYPMP